MIQQDGAITNVEGYISDVITEYSTLTYSLLEYFKDEMSSYKSLDIIDAAYRNAILEFKKQIN